MEHMIISIGNLQAFNMAAVLTDKKNHKKNTHDDFSQQSTSFLYVWPPCGLLTDGTRNDFGQNRALK